jgi:peptide-methionine (S)-S-oxide reductase
LFEFVSNEDKMTIATIAGGCFWCTEAVFNELKGVDSVESGYIGGQIADPSYEAVCTGRTGHAEAIRISFDPAVISYADLLDIFFHTHDPTTLNRQGADTGTQYRSAIFPASAEQRAEAEAAIVRNQDVWDSPIVTSIEADAPWYPAEAYHQRYFERNGTANGYCAAVVAPKLAKFRKGYAARLKNPA